MANIEIENLDADENVVLDNEAETQVEEKEEAPSMRQALKAQLDREVEKPAEATPIPAAPETEQPAPQVQAQPEKPLLAPPADMRKEEKDAFLNPTPENAHVLQAYMNRRAYETRSDYQRKMAEVEQLKQQTSGLYDVLKQHETDYAKHGISIGDVARRSIAWDKAMQSNPIETAKEWLDAYGLSVQDLLGAAVEGQQQAAPQPTNYLTKEEAERIAEEKFKTIKEQEQKNAVAYYNERIVESFLNSKPLFKDPETASQLEAEMAPIVSGLAATGRYSSPEEILETAYRYVVAGNPTFSSLTNAIAAKSTIEQKQAEVAKAKTASRSISGSAGSGTPRVQTKNLRDNLRRRFIEG